MSQHRLHVCFEHVQRWLPLTSVVCFSVQRLVGPRTVGGANTNFDVVDSLIVGVPDTLVGVPLTSCHAAVKYCLTN
jgi:hypothetical protein